MARGNLFVISGPSGTGKGNIVNRLLEKYPDVHESISCTTREKREGEAEGVDYYYISDALFDEYIAEGKFFEHARVQTDRYGTLVSVVESELESGHDLILEIDVQGCAQAMKLCPELTSIFICPPDAKSLEARLRGRNSETEENIRVRLNNAPGEIAQAYDYDYVVVSQDWIAVENALEIAVDEVYAIIKAQRLDVKNNIALLDELAASFK